MACMAFMDFSTTRPLCTVLILYKMEDGLKRSMVSRAYGIGFCVEDDTLEAKALFLYQYTYINYNRT